jgi:L-aminopeptidase/D-esterase-like protein
MILPIRSARPHRAAARRGPLALAAALLLPGALAAQPPASQPGRPAQPPRITVVGPGPTNSIVDVPGILVGQYERTDGGYRSGTTVVTTDSAHQTSAVNGLTAGYSQMGGAPGTRETDLLKPGGRVRAVQAIVLSGGSAYGLDAASGVMKWMEEHGYGVAVPGGVVPIVPSAILMDLNRGGTFKNRPDADFGYRAASAATSRPPEQGRKGAGTGAGWGLGTASVKLSNGWTVGAIVALNPGGSPVNPKTCLPYALELELASEFNIVQPSAQECQAAAAGRGGPGDGSDNAVTNTTIAVVATDAPLLDLEAERMATIANDGLARAIKPIHGIGDGDTIFGLSTSAPTGTMSLGELGTVFEAAADALGRAVVMAVVKSHQLGNSRVGYCEQYPSACRAQKTGGKD